jgi:hypothetical protein
MITITRDGDVVTLINVFSGEPQNQQHLIGRMDSSHRGNSGQASGHYLGYPASKHGWHVSSQLRPMQE